MKSLIQFAIIALVFLHGLNLHAEDGYKLWLRYAPVSDQARFESVKSLLDKVYVSGTSSTAQAIREELLRAGHQLQIRFVTHTSSHLPLRVGSEFYLTKLILYLLLSSQTIIHPLLSIILT